MSQITIWHNPRCSKSRAGMALLEDMGVDAVVYKYLEAPPSKKELSTLLSQLGITPEELMRTKEDIYKELNLKDEKNAEKLIEVMVENPKLIERPVVIYGNKATIGRPTENIQKLLAKS